MGVGSRSIGVVPKPPHPLGWSLSIAFVAPLDGGACKHHGGVMTHSPSSNEESGVSSSELETRSPSALPRTGRF